VAAMRERARDLPLELDKNLNKTIVIDASVGSGQKQPGFYCENREDECNCEERDKETHVSGR
jgi:U4/U6.U5 tri-snRNP component SNU23